MTDLPPIATKAGILARMAFVDPRTKATLGAALDLVNQTERRAAARAFLQRGWARALLHEEHQNLELLACRLRGRTMPGARPGFEQMKGRFGIAVTEDVGDPWAAQYQRVAFRRRRVRHALGQFGLAGRAVFGDQGFVQIEQFIIDDENAAAMQELRLRAGRAKARLDDKRRPEDAIADAMAEWDRETEAREAWGGY